MTATHRTHYADDRVTIHHGDCLDIRRIAYLPPSAHRQTVHIRPPGTTGGKQFDDFPFRSALEAL